jgi:hypothetical protein
MTPLKTIRMMIIFDETLFFSKSVAVALEFLILQDTNNVPVS